MASAEVLMTQIMNNPLAFVAGLAIGYIGCKLQNKFGSSGGMGGI